MNELMEFFSTYRIDWIQASLLALGVAGASGLAIKKVMGRKKKHWSESTHSENQNIVPFSVPHATNYDSMVTEEVNNLIMPKVAIDDPKDGDSDEDFTLEKPSVHSAVDISPEYHPPVTDFVAPDITQYEEMIDVPPVEEIKKEGSSEFTFLDSFDESSKIPNVVPLPYILSKPSAEENSTPEFPTLTQEDTAPKPVEKTLDPSFNLELPSLTTLYPPAAPKVEKTSDVGLNIPEEPLELTRAYKNSSLDVPTQEFVESVTLAPHIEETNEIEFIPSLKETQIEESVQAVEPILVKPIYYTGIPTLTDVVQEAKEQPQADVSQDISFAPEVVEKPVEEKFVPTVKPEIDEEKFEFTKKYHVLIEEALYFDSQNNKEAAMNSLVEAGKLIENIRVNFYLKIAMQSYKNAVTSNALPSIVNQFYIIEKEKLMKEDAQKKQDADIAALKVKKLSPIEAIKEFRETNSVSLGEAKETVMSHPAWEAQSGDNLHTQILETINEPAVEAPVDSAIEAVPPSPWEQGYVLYTSPEGELVAAKPETNETATEFMMPFPRPATPWKEGSVLFLDEGSNLMPYEPTKDLVETPVQAVEHAVEDVTAIVEESNPPLPEVNEPTIEVQIESVEDTAYQAEDVVVTQFEELPASESIDSEAPTNESNALQLHQEPVSLVENIAEPLTENADNTASTEETPLFVEEAFNSEPVLAEGVEPVSFEEAFVTTPEEVQQEVQSENQDLEAFVAEVESAPLEEVAPEPVVLTVEENEPPVEFAPFEDPVEHNASEGLLSDPELSPVAETIQQEIENTDVQEPELNQDTMAVVEPEQSITVTPEVSETITFEYAEPSLDSAHVEGTTVQTQEEPIQSTFELVEPTVEPVEEVMNVQPEIVTEQTRLENYAKVISSLEQTSSWFNKNDNMQSNPDVAPVEIVQDTNVDLENTTLPPVEKSSIEDEFSDEETKNKFMDAFGDMFKPKGSSDTPTIIIPQKRKHTVWVNWMSTEGGKMNFKNDMIELNAVWGTKTAIEDLHQQLQALVGPDNQFSVVSVFEAK